MHEKQKHPLEKFEHIQGTIRHRKSRDNYNNSQNDKNMISKHALKTTD